MLDLWIRGVPISDIARVLDANVQTIHERLKPFRAAFPKLETVNHPLERKAMIFDSLTVWALKTMLSEERLKKATSLELIKMFKAFHEAELDLV